ncbi:MAG TPA: ATP-binding cassette domain-containing protein [Bacteroidales bacterium]|jgi:ABC-type multidrug transport system ATPase subunit
MQIILEKISKKFNYEWIFRNVDYTFQSGHAYAILGSNGSGKSTLMQIIGGNLLATSGSIKHFEGSIEISNDLLYRHVSISAPYLEVIEEFTLPEILEFHRKFKPFRNNLTDSQIIEITGLTKVRNKPIRYFSSGMKQRVKLTLAIMSDTRVVLLDEPSSNLDKQGVEWYQQLVGSNLTDRIFIICSNSQGHEYSFCSQQLQIGDFKK